MLIQMICRVSYGNTAGRADKKISVYVQKEVQSSDYVATCMKQYLNLS